jgi:Membrane bound O-acyl transferase family
MKVLDWTFCVREPLQRKSSTGKRMCSTTFIKDMCDLSFNLRGIGWTWSRGYTPPPHTRPTSSTPRFLLHTLSSLIIHIILGDFFNFGIQLTDWPNFTNPQGAPLFNPRLAPIPRYLLSTFNSAAVTVILYCGIQILYDTITLITILFFNYSPTDWPPIFNEPWKATSVEDFWSNRWHQALRRSFITLGSKPLTYIVGKQCGLGAFGGFVISGLLHTLAMWKMGKNLDFFLVEGCFVMQGVGVLIERTVLQRLFGGKVGGWKGRIWAMTWIYVWNNMFMHAWCLRGAAAGVFVPPPFSPSVIVNNFVRSLISK